LNFTRVNAAGTALEFRTPAQVRSDLSINGIGSDVAQVVTNLDGIFLGGNYYSVAGATGAPPGTTALRIVHLPDVSSQFAGQIAQEAGTNRLFSRHRQSGVWQNWVEIQRVNPATLTAEGTANAGFAGGFTGRNNGGGTGTGVNFDANIRGFNVGGIHVTDDSEFGSAVRLLANRTGGSDGDRRFTAYLVDRNAAQFTAHLGAPATLLPKFDCRAWVNFDGANGAIRASGNVSSVVRTLAGHYRINFATLMPDANYSVKGSATNIGGVISGVFVCPIPGTYLPGSIEVRTVGENSSVYDCETVTVEITR
jgi:hypothetical protein